MSEHGKGWDMPKKPKRQEKRDEISPQEKVQKEIDFLVNAIDYLEKEEVWSWDRARTKFREIEYLMREFENSPEIKKGYVGTMPFTEKRVFFIVGLERLMLILKKASASSAGGKFVLVTDKPRLLKKLLPSGDIKAEMVHNSAIWKKRQETSAKKQIESAIRINFLRKAEKEKQKIFDLFIEKLNDKYFSSYDEANEALKEISRAILDYGGKYGGGRAEDDTLSRIEKKLKSKSESQRIATVRLKMRDSGGKKSIAISLNKTRDGSFELWCADNNLILK